MMLVDHKHYRQQIQDTLAHFRVTAMLGPRQCGKTTLARAFVAAPQSYFDLEDPVDLARLEAPRQTLGKLTDLVVIDEIQRQPDLFPLLRVLADRQDTPARFLILSSASPDLVKGVSESLAGRVGFVDLSGFDGTEVGFDHLDTLWLRGGFPESFLSASDDASFHWRQQFIRTFLTRDIPQLGITIPAEQLRRFWLMITHNHGQRWNVSEIAGSLGINYKTAQRYLDILTGAFMIRSLPPWTENLGKRVRKAPKIYLRDSGLFHAWNVSSSSIRASETTRWTTRLKCWPCPTWRNWPGRSISEKGQAHLELDRTLPAPLRVPRRNRPASVSSGVVSNRELTRFGRPRLSSLKIQLLRGCASRCRSASCWLRIKSRTTSLALAYPQSSDVPRLQRRSGT
jgi:predicted AAA+ superfamily ATPase